MGKEFIKIGGAREHNLKNISLAIPRNRFVVIFQWGWSYMTYDRGARLITGDTPELPRVSVRSPEAYAPADADRDRSASPALTRDGARAD